MASGGRSGEEGAAKAGEVGWAACAEYVFRLPYSRLRQPENDKIDFQAASKIIHPLDLTFKFSFVHLYIY